jgi:hypothetical protein
MEELLRRHGGNGAVSDDAKRQFRDGLWDMVAPGPAGTAARRVVGADRCFQLRHVLLACLLQATAREACTPRD